MKYITREQFNGMVKDPSTIELNDLIYVLEEQFGYSVSLEKKPQWTDEQKRRMTKAIFTNKDVLNQLQKSSLEPDESYINLDNEGEWSRYLNEVQNDD